MMERSPSVATNANCKYTCDWPSTLKVICWFIAMRSILLAHSAVTPLQELLNSRETYFDSFRRKTFQLQTMHLLLRTTFHPQETRAESFRKKAFQLLAVQLLLHTC